MKLLGLIIEILAAPQGFQQSNAAGGEQAERTQNDKEYSDKKQQKRIQRAFEVYGDKIAACQRRPGLQKREARRFLALFRRFCPPWSSSTGLARRMCTMLYRQCRAVDAREQHHSGDERRHRDGERQGHCEIQQIQQRHEQQL